MRPILIPLQARSDNGTSQYGLTKRDTTGSRGIEATERMKRIALDRRAFNRRIDEAEVEMRVVPDQHGAAAVVLSHRSPYFAEQALQGVSLIDRRAQRVIRVDTVHSQ